MTPSGIKNATFRLVAQCLNQLRHRVPHNFALNNMDFLRNFVGRDSSVGIATGSGLDDPGIES